jgi:hypothetical protein
MRIEQIPQDHEVRRAALNRGINRTLQRLDHEATAGIDSAHPIPTHDGVVPNMNISNEGEHDYTQTNEGHRS